MYISMVIRMARLVVVGLLPGMVVVHSCTLKCTLCMLLKAPCYDWNVVVVGWVCPWWGGVDTPVFVYEHAIPV